MGGHLNPHRITVALDRAGLFGPSADAKLGAVEPDLDNWEAGRSQPSRAQLERLARMANVTDSFFFLDDDQVPELTVAIMCGRGRKSQVLISMRGEPTDPPQDTLF